jgi:RimJ/RimL family protein N-acetyltransferase
MIKNGMIKEGELVDHLKKGDEYHTVIQYRLTRDEFMNKQ